MSKASNEGSSAARATPPCTSMRAKASPAPTHHSFDGSQLVRVDRRLSLASMTAAPLASTIAADDPEGSPDAVFVALSPAPTLILTEALGIPVRAQETKAS